MASTLTSPHLLLLLLCMTLFVSTTKTIGSNESTSRIVIKLIHRFSKLSPLYTPQETLVSFLEKNAQEYLATEFVNLAEDYTMVPLIRTTPSNLFLVSFLIGSPPIPQYAYMDTGSNLLWIDCSSGNRRLYNYNPKRSRVYINLPCRSMVCISQFAGRCDSSSNHCIYTQNYTGGLSSEGVVGLENLRILTSGANFAVSNVMVFGCSQRIEGKGMQYGGVNGIFGLGAWSPSFIYQKVELNRFSYCIGNISDVEYEYNTLIFGDVIANMGKQTPIQISGGHYFVTVEAMSIGTSKLKIDPDVFRYGGESASKGVIIDTGAEFTYLEAEAYNTLQEKVIDLLYAFKITQSGNRLCFLGNMTELNGLPTKFTFHLQGNVKLEGSLFYQSNRFPGEAEFCMTVVKNIHNSQLSLIGMLAQQYYYFSYDLKNETSGTLSLEKIDCAELLG